MMDFLKNTIEFIGQHGPVILFFESVYLLWQKSNLFMYYVYGFFLNLILNLILKGLIQQRRPSEDPRLFNIALKNGVRFKFINGIPHDIFGMPSGHSQSVFFSTFFIHLALKNPYITFSFLIISLLTMYQRVIFNFHTSFQVIVGAAVGCVFSYFIYYLARKNIIGKILNKPDDNAFG